VDAKTELVRVSSHDQFDSMPANPWEFEVDFGFDPAESLRKMLTVVRAIAEQPSDQWPSDDDWRSILPGWLKRAIPEMSKEETDRLLSEIPRDQWDSLPWEFLSWLDALRDRGWRWWGYRINGSSGTIVLHIATYPERIDAFRELLRAIGIRIVSERRGTS